MEVMDQTQATGTWCLEGTYTERDLRTFAAFLAGRVAGAKLWTLGLILLLPVYWSGEVREAWPFMAAVALVIIGFIVLLRFVVLPSKLYKAATKLPGVFEPRRILIDAEGVANTSAAGGLSFRLEDVQEVVAAPDHLFVMVAPKQGIPIPRAWLGSETQAAAVTRWLLSRRPDSNR
jgi:hypothetical protein